MKKKLKFIVSFAKPYKYKFIIILLVIIATTYLGMTYPYLFGKMVDSLYYQEKMSNFISLLVVYFVIFLLNQILHFTLDMVTAKTRTGFLYDIKRFIFNKVLSYKGSTLSNLKSGDIIYRMNNDTDEVMNFIYSDIFYGISAALDLILCLVATAIINVQLAGVSLLLAVLTFLLGKYFSRLVKPIQKKLASSLSDNEAWLFEILHCMRDIRLLSATKNAVKRYLKNDITAVRLSVKQAKYETVSDRSNSGMQVLCTVCIYTISAVFIFNGYLTLGGMIACLDYFQRIVLMLNRISRRFITIPNRLVAIERIMDIENIESEEYRNDLPAREIQNGNIKIKNVSFSYDKKEVLKNVSLEIKPGERMALVGGSGAGKSTLAHLICRLYDCDEGSIEIDGFNIKDYNLHDLRSQIGIAHQEVILFHNTIRYNLIFLNVDNRDDEIWSILELVKLKEYVQSLPNGLDTVLDASVRSPSGGQKQRIIIARLFLKNAPIIIFDESTSSLDRETENSIVEAWNSLLKGRTVLIIAHRLSTIINSDRVACLENGHIAGCDKHNELLKNCGEYNRLFCNQHNKDIFDREAVANESN